MDLTRLMDFHRRNNAVGTIVCHPNDHPHESDLLVLDGQKLRKSYTKKAKQNSFIELRSGGGLRAVVQGV
jgi:ADP-glucose pyrophosphorylase